MYDVVLIAGVTGSGKSALAERIALEIGGEIVNVDSLQRYVDLPSLTMRPSLSSKLSYHLYGYLDPTESESVLGWFARIKIVLSDIISRGRVPILCGGSSFYVQSLLNGIPFSEEVSPFFRELIESEKKKEGKEFLRYRLTIQDPVAYMRRSVWDCFRVMKALERWWTHSDEKAQKITLPYRFFCIILDPPKSQACIVADERLEKVFPSAMDEVHAFIIDHAIDVHRLAGGNLLIEFPVLRALGAIELISFFLGTEKESDVSVVLKKIETKTHRYIKMQKIWIRHHLKADFYTEQSGYDLSLECLLSSFNF